MELAKHRSSFAPSAQLREMSSFRVQQKIRVYWSEEKKWFTGTIDDTDWEGDDLVHHVSYTDGDKRWHNLEKERVQIIGAASTPAKPSPASSRKAAKAKSPAKKAATSPAPKASPSRTRGRASKGEEEGEDESLQDLDQLKEGLGAESVSYTHLTLPTILLV